MPSGGRVGFVPLSSMIEVREPRERQTFPPLPRTAGSLSMTKKTRPNEKPKFGQVWSWTTSGPKLVAIAVVDKDPSAAFIGIYLQEFDQEIENGYIWGNPTLLDWVLHDD
jgi:hypothetical protein